MVDHDDSTAVRAGGETDLDLMLAALTVSRRKGLRHIVELSTEEWSRCRDSGTDPPTVEALIFEPGERSVTVICTDDVLAARGWESGFAAAWLTLDVHSSLRAVGLTAAVSAALAEAGIPANMIAGFRHDHILVPEDRADDAVICLHRLSRESRAAGPTLGAAAENGPVGR